MFEGSVAAVPTSFGQEESLASGGEAIYAVSFPPAMYAQDILADRDFAAAMGYAWLHDDDTDFARSFREQMQRQAELYQQWLAKEDQDEAAGCSASGELR